MAVVLEGWINLLSLGSNTLLTSGVTNFSGDYVSESLCLYVYPNATLYAYKIQSYSGGVWKGGTASVYEKLPHSYPLYLVRSSDFSANSYIWATFGERIEEKALRKYICNVQTQGVDYYWEPATTPLSTPTGLYADNITSDSATTHWTGDANASNYKVQYKAAGDTVWTETYTD